MHKDSGPSKGGRSEKIKVTDDVGQDVGALVEDSRDGATVVESAGLETVVQDELCIQGAGWSEDELGYVFRSKH